MTELEALKIFQNYIRECILEFRKNKTRELRDFEKGVFYMLATLEKQLGKVEVALNNKEKPNVSELMAKIKKANLGVN